MENKTMKHTPGPWHAEPGVLGGEVLIWQDRSPVRIAKVALKAEQYPYEAVVANARLIAAAPELLEALKDAEFLLRKAAQIAGPMQGSFNRSAEDARAAIAKAEGH